MNDTEGSEYDRLFYPFLFEGGKANIEMLWHKFATDA